jgi:hypothetical protein
VPVELRRDSLLVPVDNLTKAKYRPRITLHPIVQRSGI